MKKAISIAFAAFLAAAFVFIFALPLVSEAANADSSATAKKDTTKKVFRDSPVAGFFKNGLKTTNDIIAATLVDQPGAGVNHREFKAYLWHEMDKRNSENHYGYRPMTDALFYELIPKFTLQNFTFHLGDYESMGRRKSNGEMIGLSQSETVPCWLWEGQPILKAPCGNLTTNSRVYIVDMENVGDKCPECPTCPPAVRDSSKDVGSGGPHANKKNHGGGFWRNIHDGLGYMLGSFFWLWILLGIMFLLWLASSIIRNFTKTIDDHNDRTLGRELKRKRLEEKDPEVERLENKIREYTKNREETTPEKKNDQQPIVININVADAIKQASANPAPQPENIIPEDKK